MTQKPVLTEAERIALRQREKHDEGFASALAYAPNAVVTQRVLEHETPAQARRRWAREAERDRDVRKTQAPRRMGRVMPVRSGFK